MTITTGKTSHSLFPWRRAVAPSVENGRAFHQALMTQPLQPNHPDASGFVRKDESTGKYSLIVSPTENETVWSLGQRLKALAEQNGSDDGHVSVAELTIWRGREPSGEGFSGIFSPYWNSFGAEAPNIFRSPQSFIEGLKNLKDGWEKVVVSHASNISPGKESTWCDITFASVICRPIMSWGGYEKVEDAALWNLAHANIQENLPALEPFFGADDNHYIIEGRIFPLIPPAMRGSSIRWGINYEDIDPFLLKLFTEAHQTQND